MAYPEDQIHAINKRVLRQKGGAADSSEAARDKLLREGFKRQWLKLGKVSEVSCSWQCAVREATEDVVFTRHTCYM